MSKLPAPRRGEVWMVDFNPSRGAETYKERPAVVVSSDGVGALPTKLVVPLTGWQDHFGANPWHVKVDVAPENGVKKASAADALQVSCVSTERFKHRLGRLPAQLLEEIVAAIAIVIEYEEPPG